MNKIVKGNSQEYFKDKKDLGIDLSFSSPSYFYNNRLNGVKEEALGKGETKSEYIRRLARIAKDVIRNSNPGFHHVIIFGTQDDSPVIQQVLMYENAMNKLGLVMNAHRIYNIYESEAICVFSKEDVKYKLPFFEEIQDYTKEGAYGVTSDEMTDYIIKKFSKKDDLVVDYFAGVGTTLLAAKNLGRRYLGIELSGTAVKRAKEKLSE